MTVGIDPRNFEFALRQIDNGFIFENFASSFLAQILGYTFVPAGGIKDRGIDGLEHIFYREGIIRSIYQSSIEVNTRSKIQRSLETLVENKIDFDQFYFISNQPVPDQDRLVDELFDKHSKPIHIYNLKWMSSRVNSNQGTINTFHTFVATYLHEYSKPGKSYVVADLINDPRLFVFLRQQWDQERQYSQLDTIVADSLILFALEGTDPDKKIFRTRDEIKKTIGAKIAFDPKTLYPIIDQRLSALSLKPRKINHHRTIDAYCLPYETRLEIQERNLADGHLHNEFQIQSGEMLKKHLSTAGVNVRDCVGLVEATFNQIYYQQGLEFADFVLKGENQEAFEKDLADTISKVVDESPVVEKNKELVKSVLMMTIREIVYQGTREQKEFLSRLSNTYLMLFLLQCDPKLGTYFSTVASKLNVYVCTSILIPAMSEILLAPENRRHWNLLKGAHDAGVTLVINETIVGELISHLQMVVNKYEDFYKDDEKIYLANEIQTLYVDEILIRAFFYAKMRGEVSSFHDFIDNFVTPNFKNAYQETIAWLKEEFGILFVSDASLNINIEKSEEERLIDRLKKHKSVVAKARNDARLILTIYAIREQNNEAGAADIFGYRTWWLSKDTVTMKAVNHVFEDKYRVSCYMRPDFLYNYISLAPRPSAIQESYTLMFPSLLGVNISYHLPTDIIQTVHQCMKDHRSKNTARRSAILQVLAQELRVDPSCRTRSYVKHYLDDKLNDLTED
jgi:hypothetical protein